MSVRAYPTVYPSPGGGGGAAVSVMVDTIANILASTPTDDVVEAYADPGPYEATWNGSLWIPRCYGQPVELPSDGVKTWTYRDNSSAGGSRLETQGMVQLTAPGTGSTASRQGVFRGITSGAGYYQEMAFRTDIQGGSGTGSNYAGVMLFDSVNAEFVCLEYLSGDVRVLYGSNLNASAGGATGTVVEILNYVYGRGDIYARLGVIGTNATVQYGASTEGPWTTAVTVPLATCFPTAGLPDEVGAYVANRDGGQDAYGWIWHDREVAA